MSMFGKSQRWFDQEARIVEGAEVSFCTNVMLGTGTVYKCKVGSDRVAVVESSLKWQGMNFYAPKEDDAAGRKLGEVIVVHYPGSSSPVLAIKNESGWPSLYEGRG